MDGDIVALALKDFGPAGGLAILLLAASVYANYLLFRRLTKEHDRLAAADVEYAEELATAHADCEKEKLVYRDATDARYRESVATFLERDNQKRQDIAVLFERFEHLIGVITAGLDKVGESNVQIRYELKDMKGRRS